MKKLKITEIERLSLEDFATSHKVPLVLVLDNVRSMNNIGSVFRSADAFRIERIILCGITACPPHPDIHKTALGAEDSVAWSYVADTPDAIDALRLEGYRVYALEQAHGSLSLEAVEVQPHEHYALVLGNEVHGVQQSVVDLCHGCIEIPQYGTKHSLNVSVAAGIALWQLVQPHLSKLSTP